MALVQQSVGHSNKSTASVLGWGWTCPPPAQVLSEELLGASVWRGCSRRAGMALKVKNRVFIQCLHS